MAGTVFIVMLLQHHKLYQDVRRNGKFKLLLGQLCAPIPPITLEQTAVADYFFSSLVPAASAINLELVGEYMEQHGVDIPMVHLRKMTVARFKLRNPEDPSPAAQGVHSWMQRRTFCMDFMN